ncbi:MAG: hypothetical protein QNJ04_09095 [Desulfobacterales bacterium]|nr:hypothetical protein [Desulfobacterales bacterium]
MASDMTDRLPPNTDAPAPEVENRLPDRLQATPAPKTPTRLEDVTGLEEVETMLRTAAQTISPDPDEIRDRMARARNADTEDGGRQVSFGLILTVVALVFLILALDLLLGGA